jgi:hypothetical protein
MDKLAIIREDLTPEEEFEGNDKTASDSPSFKISQAGTVNRGTEKIFIRLLEVDGVDGKASE